MKEKELRDVITCNMCGKSIAHTGLPLFWRVKIRRYGLKADALRRQQGLTMMLGGHAALASVMGPDEDLAEKLFETEITVCEDCVSKQTCVAILAEKGDE